MSIIESFITGFDPSLLLDAPAAPRRNDILDMRQDAMIEDVMRCRREGRKSIVARAATGTGKTYMTAKFIRRGIEEWDGRFLFLANRKKLIDQAADEFAAAGIGFAIEQGERNSIDALSLFGGVRVVIASNLSLHDRRITRFPKDAFTDIITDECHYAPCKAFTSVYNYFDWDHHLGLSATPFRMDGKPIWGSGALFETQACHYSLPDAIRDGTLTPIKVITGSTRIDLSKVRTTRTKDFDVSDLEERISEVIGPLCSDVADQFRANGIRKAILFAPDVGSARAFADVLSSEEFGLRARVIHGNSKRHPITDRQIDDLWADFESNEFDVLCSCDMATTGVNIKDVECVVMLRPTKSIPLFFQMVGRGTRLYPGKQWCHVLGFTWLGDEDICSTVDLFLEDEPDNRVRQRASQKMQGKPKGADPSKAVEEAKKELAEEDADQARREARKLKLRAKRQATKTTFTNWTPFAVGERFGVNLAEHAVSGAAGGAVTFSQARTLRQYGVKDASGITANQADALIEQMIVRDMFGLARPGQVDWLVKHAKLSEAQAQATSFEDARRIFGEITGKF